MTITGNTFKPEFFFVSPMEVVKVTTENLNEVAEWCGGEVAETESRRVKGRMDKYVWVPTPKGTKISWAFPGMYISKRMVVTLKDELVTTYSVFRKDYFSKNYFGTPNEAVEATWERADKEAKKARIAKENKDRLKNVTKKQNGAPISQIMGTTPTEMVVDEAQSLGEAVALVEKELGGEVIDVYTDDFLAAQGVELAPDPDLNGGEIPIGVEAVTKVITIEEIAEMEGITIEQAKETIQVLEPFRPVYWHVGEETYLVSFDEGGRETPHSPLPEPREAEEHERIAEEMEPASVVTYLHDHSYQVPCSDSDCSTERFVDGMHIFTDVEVEADEKGWRIVDDGVKVLEGNLTPDNTIVNMVQKEDLGGLSPVEIYHATKAIKR